jgi:glycosyltransferase involved in cell wall biosynthesis
MVHHYEWRPRTVLQWFSRYLRARKKLKHFFKTQSPPFVHSNSALLTVGAEISASEAIPHLWHLREFGDLDYGLQWFIPRAYHQRLLHRAAGIICVSRAVADHYGVGGWPKTHILYNGVMSRGEMGFLKTERRPHEPFRFGCVGMLSDAKAFDLAIKALSRCADEQSELLIFGDGPNHIRAKLMHVAASCGLSHRVKFKGFVANPREIYRQIDCLLVTSRNEAFGRVTAEAMGYGVPILGRNSAGTSELIESGVNGLLFDGTELELAILMCQISNNLSHALQRSERGLQQARALFSIEAYSEGFMKIAAPFC